MTLPPDPFGRARLPTAVAAAGTDRFSREARVALVARAAEDLVACASQMPHPAAALFLGSALQAWLQGGGAVGALERDYLEVTGPARSRLTPAKLWARCAATATSALGANTIAADDQPEPEQPS